MDSPTGGCYSNGVTSSLYNGEINTLFNFIGFFSLDCTDDPPDDPNVDLSAIQAEDEATALAIMDGLDTYVFVVCTNSSSSGFSVPTDIWGCAGIVF